MTRLAIAMTVLAMGAAARDTIVPLSFGVMGHVVKSAPYWADEVSESSRVLGDGTHIRQQSQVTVYRDSEGRVRRESPTESTIWDPVADVIISLLPKTMTAIQSPIGKAFTKVTSDNATVAQLQKLTAELEASRKMMVNGNPVDTQTADVMKEKLDRAMASVSKNSHSQTIWENLGQKSMEGVTIEGTRGTTTIETGAIGNDRPIRSTVERWSSSELQITMMQTTNDPRSGEETLRLVNIHRGEPSLDLFRVPPGYQVIARTGAAKN
jgi:hypothetical protein